MATNLVDPATAAGTDDIQADAAAAGTPARSAPPPEVDDLIESAQAEVFLLLDNISATKSKTLPPAIKDDSLFKDGDKGWLEQVCDIKWPPTGDQTIAARSAAKLLRVRDMLNTAAAPATGYTIAFTLMIAGEAADRHERRWRWRRTWPFLYRETPVPSSTSAGKQQALTRCKFAVTAFPLLRANARNLSLHWVVLRWLLVAWLGVTLLFSWHVATGVSLLDRFGALDTRVAALSADVAVTNAQKPSVTDAAQASGGDAAGAESDAEAKPAPAASPTALAAAGGQGGEVTEATSVAKRPPDGRERERDEARLLRERARENLGLWLQGENWGSQLFLRFVLGGQQEQPYVKEAGTVGAAPEARANVEWARVYIGLLAGVVLPVVYGILGAWACVVRSISAKLRSCTLYPRDIQLAWVQLGLGAVIAGCIGLFVPGGGTSADDRNLFTTVPLTLSALCFIAGFGVEGVFQTLEELVRRVFNLEAPTPAPSP